MLNIWKLLQIVFNASKLEKMGVTVVWLREVFCEVFALVKRLITNWLMFNSSLPRFLFSLICGKEHLKDFCLVYNFNFVCYNLGGGEQSRIILAERRENGRLGPLWAVCFLSAEQMPGRPASLLCQSQAIRANGSTCLYVGRVWGFLFSGTGLFLFPGSWKTPGLENALYSESGRQTGPGTPICHPHPARGSDALPRWSLDSICKEEHLERDELCVRVWLGGCCPPSPCEGPERGTEAFLCTCGPPHGAHPQRGEHWYFAGCLGAPRLEMASSTARGTAVRLAGLQLEALWGGPGRAHPLQGGPPTSHACCHPHRGWFPSLGDADKMGYSFILRFLASGVRAPNFNLLKLNSGHGVPTT